MSQTEQNKPVRSREDVSTINRISASIQPNWQNDPSEAELQFFYGIAEKAFDAATAEQRRKDGEGHEPVAWLVNQKGVDAPFFTQNIHATKSEFVTSLTPLYTHPANVAALEGRIAELEKEVLEEQRISNLRGDAIDGWINTSSQQSQEIDEMRERVRELEGALREIIDTAGADCIHGLGPYIKIAQAALTREGGV